MPPADEPQIELDRVPAADVVEFGGTRRQPPPWRRLILPAILVLAVIAAAVTAYTRNGHPAAAPPSTSPTPAAQTGSATASSSPSPATGPVTKILGGPLLGITDRWELFGYTGNMLVRIQPAAGRLTQTPVPSLASSGSVALIVTDRAVVVRPLDRVNGYLVPDDQPAIALSGPLAEGSRVLPGPRAGTIWVEHDGGSLQLVGPDGKTTGEQLTVPVAIQSYTVPDGRGYALAIGVGGVYSVRPSGVHRITTGVLLAVGPTGWLTLDCDAVGACEATMTDSGTGSSRRIPSWTKNNLNAFSPGALSPNGRYTAVLDPSAGLSTLVLVDVATGNPRKIPVQLDPETYGDLAFAWTPDSRWLLYPDREGSIQALDPTTGISTVLIGSLPRITQLALRPAPAP